MEGFTLTKSITKPTCISLEEEKHINRQQLKKAAVTHWKTTAKEETVR